MFKQLRARQVHAVGLQDEAAEAPAARRDDDVRQARVRGRLAAGDGQLAARAKRPAWASSSRSISAKSAPFPVMGTKQNRHF